jgi:hypothetical protein
LFIDKALLCANLKLLGKLKIPVKNRIENLLINK